MWANKFFFKIQITLRLGGCVMRDTDNYLKDH